MGLWSLLIVGQILFWSKFVFAFSLSSSPENYLEGFNSPTISVHLSPVNCGPNTSKNLNKALSFLNSTARTNLNLVRGKQVRYRPYQLKGFLFPEQIVVTCSNEFKRDSIKFSPNRVAAIATNNFPQNPITKGYIVLNFDSFLVGRANASFRNPRYTDLRKTIIIAHELGHVLGLGHSSSPQSLMNKAVWQKRFLSFHPDDINGFSFLYPVRRQSQLTQK